MKKTLLIAALALIGAGICLLANPVSAYTSSQGDLIKISGNPAIYYIDGSGYRHLFPTEATFFSWHTGSWRDQSITTVSSYEFNLIPAGKNITARPGYALLRFENSLVMYAVLPGGRLCHAPAHYNNYQYNRALVIPVGFQTDYYSDSGCDITASTDLPDGTLLRYSGSSDIYYIQNGQRRRVTSYGQTANRLRNESIITEVDWSMSYVEGPILDGYDYSVSDLNYQLANYNYYNNYNYSYNSYCSENWTCGAWSICSNGYQYRNCSDSNNCGTVKSKPATSQSCSSYNYICSENWICGAWSACAYGQSYRTCYDANNCGTANSKPVVSQTCQQVCQENWTCGSWGACQTTGLSNGWQFRTCTDANACGTTKNKPTTNQVCQTCQTNWSCTSWTTCSGGQQYRDCLDTNRCGSTSGKPALTRSCS
ncbi:MAG: hypothetical protein WC517_02040 [Patescibacteria group bacterium]